MNAIVFSAGAFETVRQSLLKDAPRERATLLLAAPVDTARGRRFLVRRDWSIPSVKYATQTESLVVIPPREIADAMKAAREEGLTLLLAHSHPCSDHPSFSPVDDDGEEALASTLFFRLDERPHASLVVGREGFDARCRTSDGRVHAVERVDDVGPHIGRFLSSRAASLPNYFLGASSKKWDRNVRALGEHGQEILSTIRAGIVGLGGTGSLVAEQLAYLGIRSFVLLDPDDVDESNTNRVIGSVGNVGVAKVESARRLLTQITPDAEVQAIRGVVHRKADALPLLDADLIFCCTDSHGSRAVVNQLAYQYVIPTIDLGIRIDAQDEIVQRITGRVQMLAPGLSCLLCQNFLDPEQVRRDLLSDEDRTRDQYIVGAHVPQPAVISLNATVASLAVTMMLAALTKLPLDSRHQVYLADQGVVRNVSAEPRPDCIVCSSSGALARGDTWRMPWRLN